MALQKITFLTIAAYGPLALMNASGQPFTHRMIVGIKVGKSSEVFKHPQYDLLVEPEARPKPQEIVMPPLMAARVLAFARTCLIPDNRDYNSFDFTLYACGLQAAPAHQSSRPLRLDVRSVVGDLRKMHQYFICSEGYSPLHAFIGLDGKHALSVLGFRGPLGIARVDDLVRALRGAVIGHVTPRV
jgi:hypothetical protein